MRYCLMQAFHVLEMTEHGTQADARAGRNLLGAWGHKAVPNQIEHGSDDPLLAVVRAKLAAIGWQSRFFGRCNAGC